METMSSSQTDNRLMGRKTQTQCDTHEKDIGWLLTLLRKWSRQNHQNLDWGGLK